MQGEFLSIKTAEKIARLERENEKLKIQLLEKKISDKDVEYQERIKIQKRNEKAIKYILEHTRIDSEYPDYIEMLIEERDFLLKILRGEEE